MATAEEDTPSRQDPPPMQSPDPKTSSGGVPALRDPAPDAAPAPRRRLWLWVLAGLVAVGIAGFGAGQIWMAQPPAVSTEIAAPGPVTRALAVNGRIAALHSVDVQSPVSGTLLALPVAEGDRVAQDQVLARVDPRTQTAIVRQAMAALDAALIARQQAAEAHDRAQALGDTIARTTLEERAHALEAAQQEVARLTAAVDQAQVALENHTIRAPAPGTIVTLHSEAGQIVGPSTPLLTLADLGDLVVEADVDETYATQITLGQSAVLRLAGESGTRAGHVSFVSSRVDVATGGLAIRIALDDPVRAPIGLTVASNIVVDQRNAAISVPRTALIRDGDGPRVLIVEDGVARARPVEVIDWPAARLIVTDGLAGGETIITDAQGLTDGQAVTVTGS